MRGINCISKAFASNCLEITIITIIILKFTVCSAMEDFESPPNLKNRKLKNDGTFLRLFSDCLVQFTGEFNSPLEADGQKEQQWLEKVRYIKHFGTNETPLILSRYNSSSHSTDNASTLKIAISSEENFKNCRGPQKFRDSNKCEDVQVDVDAQQSLKAAGGRKNLQCNAQFYFLNSIVGVEGERFLSLHKLLEDVIFKSANPDYILFIKSNGKEESSRYRESELGFFSNLYRLTLTAKFIVIDGKRKTVKMLCMHCRGSLENQFRTLKMGKNGDDGGRYSASSVRSLQDLNTLWTSIHHNLLGRPVEAIKYHTQELSHYLQYGCGLYKAGLKTDANICAKLTISQNLNFTPFIKTSDYKIYGQIKSGMMSYSAYNEQLFLTPSKVKHEWLSTAEYFEPFIYIVIVDRDALNISALWRTFNLQTWLVLLLTFVGLSGLFAASISSNYEVLKNRLNNLRFTFILFTGILLEQSQLTFWKVSMELSRVSKILIISWIGFSVIISSLYKGTVFAYLTTSIPPPIPHTTKDLVESPYFIMTTTSYHFQGRQYSTLIGILDEMMVGRAGVDYPPFYKDLKDNLHFIPSSHADIVKAHKLSAQLLALDHVERVRAISSTGSVTNVNKQKSVNNDRRDKNNSHLNPNVNKLTNLVKFHINDKQIFQNVSIPENFAIIGSEYDVETLRKLLQTFTSSFVLKSKTAHTFLNRTPWVIRRNFFISLFQPSLAHLFESGIYMRWRRLSEMSALWQEYQNVRAQLLEKGTSSSSGDPNPNDKRQPLTLLDYGLLDLEIKKNHEYTLVPRPLSFEVFDSAFVFYVLCTAGSIAVYMSEWLFFIFCRIVFNEHKNVVGHMKI